MLETANLKRHQLHARKEASADEARHVHDMLRCHSTSHINSRPWTVGLSWTAVAHLRKGDLNVCEVCPCMLAYAGFGVGDPGGDSWHKEHRAYMLP